jgi:hypothetical protein
MTSSYTGTTPASNLQTLYDRNGQCAGFLLSRGVAGFEGFYRDDKSVGLFRDPVDAANAVLSRVEAPK